MTVATVHGPSGNARWRRLGRPSRETRADVRAPSAERAASGGSIAWRRGGHTPSARLEDLHRAGQGARGAARRRGRRRPERRGRESPAASRRRDRPLREREDLDAALARRERASTARPGGSRSSSPMATSSPGRSSSASPSRRSSSAARHPAASCWAMGRRALGVVGARPAPRDVRRGRRGERSRA